MSVSLSGGAGEHPVGVDQLDGEVEVMVCVVHPCLPASHILPDARPGLAAGTAQLGELSSRDDPARLVRAWARDAPAPVTTGAAAGGSSHTEHEGRARAWPAD